MKELESKLEKSMEVFEKNITNIRTGRASPAMVETVKIEAYGSKSPLKNLASINTMDVRTLKLQPFDPSTLNAIEKGIQEANLGLSIRNDGRSVMLGFPELNEERRTELIKLVKQEAENTRVAMRNQRRDYLDHLKKTEEISQDEMKGHQEKVQKVMDQYMEKIEELVQAKEKAITTV